MYIERIGFTPIKGARHLEHATVELSAEGPVGDRVFALVDLSRGRVLRTVENPRLLSTEASWTDGVLSVLFDNSEFHDGLTITGTPASSGSTLECEYWGRPARVEVVDGEWAQAYSTLLGQDVALTRSVGSGEVVYGASVTVVTTGQLRELASKTGQDIDPRRFRATFVIESDSLDPGQEWYGHELELGTARIRIFGEVDRCAVIDFDSETGATGTRLLRTLAGYRLQNQLIEFGMYAEVTTPGVVRKGDSVTLIR